ncbi:T-complex protein 11-like protein 1 isoform X2 [Anabrus simplex]
MASNRRSRSPADMEEGAVGGAPRQRQESEGDEDSEQGKRIRTGQQSFAISSVPASPPTFVSLEEIMQAAKGMKNMMLAHEIAVDKDFKLQTFEPPENSIHKQVKDTIHRAFWDVLTSQLAEDPPNYSQAMVLLENIKENLLSLLLPQHTKLRQEINEVLDLEVIEQQIEAGTLNFQEYAHYVISVMGKMCAPARDERIRELTQTTEVVPVFRGILETLDLMKLDMANFTISLIRPNIIATSIEYERKKFAEILKVQPDGLAITRAWLLTHLNAAQASGTVELQSLDDQSYINKLTEQILAEAYLELLEWKSGRPFPETCVMDEARFGDLGVRTARLALVGAILLVTTTCAKQLQSVTAFKQDFMKHVNILLVDAQSEKDVENVMGSIAVQVIKDVNEALPKYGHKMLDSDGQKFLEGQILAIAEDDHKIKQLVRVRICEFLKQTITSPTAAPVQIPPGLSSLQEELTYITGQFLRLVSHNRAVFSQYYVDIVAEAMRNR